MNPFLSDDIRLLATANMLESWARQLRPMIGNNFVSTDLFSPNESLYLSIINPYLGLGLNSSPRKSRVYDGSQAFLKNHSQTSKKVPQRSMSENY